MSRFLSGMLAAFALAIAVFFLKFMRESKDRLFGFFAAAFAVLAVDWAAHALVNASQHYLFVIRLVSFLLIIAGVVDKNRSRRQ